MENWAIIEGFESYEVSDLGKIRRKLPGRGTKVGKVLKPSLRGSKKQLSNGKSYPGVGLVNDGKRYNFFVHILVAKAFVSNPDPNVATQVNHIDGVKTNAKAINLEWRSKRGDTIHAMKAGLRGTGVRRCGKVYGAAYTPDPQSLEVWLGTFNTKEEAQTAYKAAVAGIPDEL